MLFMSGPMTDIFLVHDNNLVGANVCQENASGLEGVSYTGDVIKKS